MNTRTQPDDDQPRQFDEEKVRAAIAKGTAKRTVTRECRRHGEYTGPKCPSCE